MARCGPAASATRSEGGPDRCIAGAPDFPLPPLVRHERLECGILPHWVEELVLREPWVARKARVDRPSQPVDGLTGLGELRIRGCHPVAHMMVGHRTRREPPKPGL